jgi:predicted Rdx family selenoprotein
MPAQTLFAPRRRASTPRASVSRRRRWHSRALLSLAFLLALAVLYRPLPHPDVSLPGACAALQAKFAPRGRTSRQWAARSALYARIVRSLEAEGLTGVSGTGGTQGLAVQSLFSWDDTPGGGLPQPQLRRLRVPVRAVVLPLPLHARAASVALSEAAAAVLQPLLTPSGVWLQEPRTIHASLMHASHHMWEVPASAAQVDAEAAALRAVLNATCPLRAVLERVVVTPGGVIMACWNVAQGGQPQELRGALRAALPRAPMRQLVSEPLILHSTLARVLRTPPGGVAILQPAITALSAQLCGLEVLFDVAWFVEELDALALALRGEYRARAMPLACPPAPARGGRLLDRA